METQRNSSGSIQSKSPSGSIDGIFRIADLTEELAKIKTSGLDCGVSTGWASLDRHYRVKKGMMTIVSGIPQSGKSEFIDALVLNLAMMLDWKFAMFSPENYPILLHVIKLIEKMVGKQFNGKYSAWNMNEQEAGEAIEFIGDHFTWIYPDETEKINLELILSKTDIIRQQSGLDGLVIDPWNELEHDRNGKSETDYISECLTRLRRFTRKHNIKSWLVAHPQKLTKNKDGKYDVPTPYDISGSSHWRNKADFILCAHRVNLQVDNMDLYIQKVKFKHLGKVGMTHFDYDWKSGRFNEVNDGNIQ